MLEFQEHGTRRADGHALKFDLRKITLQPFHRVRETIPDPPMTPVDQRTTEHVKGSVT